MGVSQVVKETRVLRVDPCHPEPEVVARAAEVIRAGGTVAFPTETVYGLGANALDAAAVREIFRAKGRPPGNPLIVHVAAVPAARDLVVLWPEEAELLARRFWPGPLTFILPKASCVPAEVTAGLDTVALRIPAHPVALALIEAAGVPVAAPSANTSGRPSPTRPEHVLADLAGKFDLLLDGGPTGVGVESTILDLTGEVPVILRPGGVTAEALEAVLGRRLEVSPAVLRGSLEEEGTAPCPGFKFRHYAPRASVLILTGDPEEQAEKARRYLRENPGVRQGLLVTSENAPRYRTLAGPGVHLVVLGARARPEEIAARLFGALRECEEVGAEVILVEAIPPTGMGLAVMNRLYRAAENRTL